MLLGLQVADVDFAKGVIKIKQQLDRTGRLTTPKTENGVRTISIPERLRVALLAQHNANPDKSPAAFLFGQHTQPEGRYRLAARALAKAIKDSGIEYDPEKERISFHCFRHTVAAMLCGGRRSAVGGRVPRDDVQTFLSTYVHSNGGGGNIASILEEVAA